MSPEKQRVALAEFAGWLEITPETTGVIWPSVEYSNTSTAGFMYLPGTKVGTMPPDYLRDLNAIHDLFQLFSDSQYESYRIQIRLIMHRDITLREPSASQKAEAILVAIRKWEESE